MFFFLQCNDPQSTGGMWKTTVMKMETSKDLQIIFLTRRFTDHHHQTVKKFDVMILKPRMFLSGTAPLDRCLAFCHLSSCFDGPAPRLLCVLCSLLFSCNSIEQTENINQWCLDLLLLPAKLCLKMKSRNLYKNSVGVGCSLLVC
jgi:hypothetical protein